MSDVLWMKNTALKCYTDTKNCCEFGCWKTSCTSGLCWVEENLTWAESIAGDLLHRHALTERSSVQRSGVSAGPRSLLNSSPTVHAARRPLSPQRPTTVHWRERSSTEQHNKWTEEITFLSPCQKKHPEDKITNRLKENLHLYVWFDFL